MPCVNFNPFLLWKQAGRAIWDMNILVSENIHQTVKICGQLTNVEPEFGGTR